LEEWSLCLSPRVWIVALSVLSAAPVAEGAPENEEIRRRIGEVKPTVYQLEAHAADGQRVSYGTGFAIDASGRIATAFHVIRNAARVDVKNLQSETVGVATEVDGYDPTHDFAILKLAEPSGKERPPMPYLELDATLPAEEARLAMVVGNPQAIPGLHPVGFTFGRSRIDMVPELRRSRSGFEVILLPSDFAYYGASGAPVIDVQTGKCFGIVLGTTTMTRYSIYAIPAQLVDAALRAPTRTALSALPSGAFQDDKYYQYAMAPDPAPTTFERLEFTVLTVDEINNQDIDATLLAVGTPKDCTPGAGPSGPQCSSRLVVRSEAINGRAPLKLPAESALEWKLYASKDGYRDLEQGLSLSTNPEITLRLSPLQLMQTADLLYVEPRLLGLKKSIGRVKVRSLANPYQWHVKETLQSGWFKLDSTKGTTKVGTPVSISYVDQPRADDRAEVCFEAEGGLSDVLTLFPEEVPELGTRHINGVVTVGGCKAVSGADGPVRVVIQNGTTNVSGVEQTDDNGRFDIDIEAEKLKLNGLTLRAYGKKLTSPPIPLCASTVPSDATCNIDLTAREADRLSCNCH